MDLLTQDQRSRVEHVACDFLSKPEEIAKQLKEKNVTADYVFFCTYSIRLYWDMSSHVRVRRLVRAAKARRWRSSLVERPRIERCQLFVFPFMRRSKVDINPAFIIAALLSNFTKALDNVGIVPKRLLLQTGAKNYGVHLGRYFKGPDHYDRLFRGLRVV